MTTSLPLNLFEIKKDFTVLILTEYILKTNQDNIINFKEITHQYCVSEGTPVQFGVAGWYAWHTGWLATTWICSLPARASFGVLADNGSEPRLCFVCSCWTARREWGLSRVAGGFWNVAATYYHDHGNQVKCCPKKYLVQSVSMPQI